MEKDTFNTQPEETTLEAEMFAAATREDLFGYDFCLARGIGQQAVWNTYKPRKEWVQDALPFGE